MPNSSTTIAQIVGHSRTYPDIAPIVQTAAGGASLQPSLTIASDVMIELISQVFNWKWNRFLMPTVLTNSWQQDYALNVVNLGWLEHGFAIDINNTAYPQPRYPVEAVKDLESTSSQSGRPSQACWLPNDQLYYGTWGAANPGGSGGPNPQPNQVIGTLLGVTVSPQNPYLQVKDSFNNLWVVTGFGTTGATNPFLVNLNPVFPTPANPNQIATTVTDGSVTWTAVNPKGSGLRINPLPPQTGVIYQINMIGQYRPFAFTNGPFTAFNQTIEPIPDDFAKYFRDGFVAMAYNHSSDKNVRGKFQDQYNIWKKALLDSKIQGDREREGHSFFPSQGIMQPGTWPFLGPSWPYLYPFQ